MTNYLYRLIFVAIVELVGTAISIYLLCKAKKKQEYIWSIFLLLLYALSLIADLIKIFSIGV